MFNTKSNFKAKLQGKFRSKTKISKAKINLALAKVIAKCITTSKSKYKATSKHKSRTKSYQSSKPNPIPEVKQILSQI